MLYNNYWREPIEARVPVLEHLNDKAALVYIFTYSACATLYSILRNNEFNKCKQKQKQKYPVQTYNLN